ncbi:MAG: helix-turn-helix domain-containing protein [Prevotella sp.]|nr:helix-turn-helix domain-containing protein [Prevotella sp.]
MNNNDLLNITVESARERNSGGSFIDNDFALVDDFTKLTFPEGPRRLKCLILAICTQGNAEYRLDTIRHQVLPGDIIIINSGQVIDDFSQSADCLGAALVVSDPFFYEIMSGVHDLSYLFIFSRTHPVFHLTEEEMHNTMNYISLIKSKVENAGHRFRRDTVRSLIQALIYDTGETIARIQDNPNTKNSRAESIYVEFMMLVERAFRRERRVAWYARKLAITPKYLAETIKLVSRRTPNDWIDDYVVLELRVLLKNTTKSIKEIAEHMHFPNQSFLGKYFKEHVGMSPSEYRKK